METEPSIQSPVQRLRMTFTKGGAVRYIGHLDMARALERALNRARVPVAYTQGFNRRPRLSLAAALPLGYTSQAEMADVWLVEHLEPAQLIEMLESTLPQGISIVAVDEVPLNGPSVQQLLTESTFAVTFLDPVDADRLRDDVARMLAAAELPRERKKDKQRSQPYDLRPLLIDLQLSMNDAGAPQLVMRLRQSASQFGRPDEVLRELGIDPFDARIHRLAIGLAVEPHSAPGATEAIDSD